MELDKISKSLKMPKRSAPLTNRTNTIDNTKFTGQNSRKSVDCNFNEVIYDENMNKLQRFVKGGYFNED
jgi:hypothetical protein